MKNIFKYLPLCVLFIFLNSCFGDRLQPIRSLGRSEKLEDKTKASLLYQDAIKTMMEAYVSSAGLNKDIANRLMNTGAFEKAIEHLKLAVAVRNNDASIYHDLAICYVSLYKIHKKTDMLNEAETCYSTALRISPENKGILYDYAHLLVFGLEDYEKAVTVLNTYIYTLGTPDKNGYFLLGRALYMLGEMAASHKVYSELYQLEKQLSEEEKTKLEEFMRVTEGQ